MKKLIILIVSGVLIILGLLGAVSCSALSESSLTPSPTQAVTNSLVIMKNLKYSPSTITISVGTTVNWVNQESLSHTITSDTELFDSGVMSEGESYSFTFNEKGTFQYHCTLHSGMRGTVIVQ